MNNEYGSTYRDRVDRDFVMRSGLGIAIYIVLWPCVFLATGLLDYYPVFCLLTSGAITVIGAVRYMLNRRFDTPFYHRHRRLWRSLTLGLALGHAICFSTIINTILATHGMRETVIIALIGLAAIISGAVHSLSTHRLLVQAYIAILIIPSIIIAVVTDYHFSLSVILTGYWIYMAFLSLQLHNEYFYNFRTEYELLESKSKLERMSRIDVLTGVYNRRCFNESLRHHFNIAIRQNKPLSILMIDVDYFKQINDNHGHLFGDECLIFIAQRVRQIARRCTDLITRYGGEEFAVILPDTTLQDACNIAEEIRRSIQQHSFSIDQQQVSLTISSGVSSVVPNPGMQSLELVKQADQALYQAKASGRNCVCSYRPDTTLATISQKKKNYGSEFNHL